MTINKIIKQALDPLGYPVKPGEYRPPDKEDGEEPQTYITFNSFSNPDDFGNDEPGHEVHSIQVHLFCPQDINCSMLCKQIKTSLANAGFTYPHKVDASDNDGQHHIFECMIALGVE